MNTSIRPNTKALYDALEIYRDSMRAFVVRDLKGTRRKSLKEIIRESLDPGRREAFERNLERGASIRGAIDDNHIPVLIERNWRTAFRRVFKGDKTALATLKIILDVRNRVAHPTNQDLESEYVRSSLYHIADMMGKIKRPDSKRAVENIRDQLFRGKSEGTASPTKPTNGEDNSNDTETIHISRKFWVNRDSTGKVLHRGTCRYVRDYAVKPKWVSYNTEQKALAAYPGIHKCGVCW